jgi:hypothetical protein
MWAAAAIGAQSTTSYHVSNDESEILESGYK